MVSRRSTIRRGRRHSIAIFEGLIELTEAKRVPWATEVRAFDPSPNSIAKLHDPEVGQQISRALARIAQLAEPAPLEAASDVLAQKIDTITRAEMSARVDR